MTKTEQDLFLKYIAPDCDRKTFIQNFLNQNGLDAPVLNIENKNHIYVKFPLEQYDSMFKIKTVIAHYDRVPDSPGANDNSFANFCILQWAAKLAKMSVPHNIRIIFTDGEELGGNTIKEQGAFGLALLYKKLGIMNDEIYVFDSMGRGNIPVICQSNLPAGVNRNFINRLNALESKVEKLLRKANDNRWFCLKSNYSDNASFLVNGIPAVAVTMLPALEIDAYVKSGIQPLTWQMFHTCNDNFEHLTAESYAVFNRILAELALQKTLVEL